MKVGATIFTAVVSLIGGAIGASLIIWICAIWPSTVNEIEAVMITGLSAAGVGLLAVIIAVWGVISSRAIARRQTTFSHIATLETDGSAQHSQQIFNDLVRTGKLTEYAKKNKEGTVEAQAILNVLNGFELMSIGIQRGIIEPEFYQLWYRSQVVHTWKNAQPFIVALRARLDRPSLFHEFEEMARWMNKNQVPHRRFWWTGII